jgi:hypothetical protein
VGNGGDGGPGADYASFGEGPAADWPLVSGVRQGADARDLFVEDAGSTLAFVPTGTNRLSVVADDGTKLLTLDVVDGRWSVVYDSGRLDLAAARFVEVVRGLLGQTAVGEEAAELEADAARRLELGLHWKSRAEHAEARVAELEANLRDFSAADAVRAGAQLRWDETVPALLARAGTAEARAEELGASHRELYAAWRRAWDALAHVRAELRRDDPDVLWVRDGVDRVLGGPVPSKPDSGLEVGVDAATRLAGGADLLAAIDRARDQGWLDDLRPSAFDPEDAVRATVGNARLAGYEPTPADVALWRHVARGEVTADAAVAEIVERYERAKTPDLPLTPEVVRFLDCLTTDGPRVCGDPEVTS